MARQVRLGSTSHRITGTRFKGRGRVATKQKQALVKDMDVDQSVAPVSHTCGGSSEGYARWQAWVNAGNLALRA